METFWISFDANQGLKYVLCMGSSPFLVLTDHATVLSSMDQVVTTFRGAFEDYNRTASNSDLVSIQQVCTSLGLSWDDAVNSWQNASIGTPGRGDTMDIDFVKQYVWYAGALTGIVNVRTLFIL